MEKALWYLLAGTRGGRTRAEIIRALSERPRNANQVAEAVDVDYDTARHHLDTMLDHGIVEDSGADYGNTYFLTDRFEQHREAFEEIIDQVE
ncbi:MAG: winged helix-turn-helix domain-containing protein [Halobacteriaceae archaeon]